MTIIVNARDMDYNFVVPSETFLEGDTTIVPGSALIQDRAAFTIMDRAGNEILSRTNWNGKPILLTARNMDYNMTVET